MTATAARSDQHQPTVCTLGGATPPTSSSPLPERKQHDPVTQGPVRLAALVGALSIAAAPAYAGGISAHKAAQQLKADIETLVPAFKHFEGGIKQWAKDNAGASDCRTEPIVTQVVNAIATVGHRLRTYLSFHAAMEGLI